MLAGTAAVDAADGHETLAAQVRSGDPAVRGVLADWLGAVRTAGSLAEALARRDALADGDLIVTPGGDLVTRSSVTFFAPDQGEHGLLERQREIEALAEGIALAEEQAEARREQLAMLDEQLADKQEEIGETQQYVADRQQRVHAVQLDVLRLSQAITRYREQK
jgi:chromosome segregation protein